MNSTKNNGGRIQIHFRLDRHENQALFEYLACCPKGSCRTALLKLLAHEGMRGLLLQGDELKGNRTQPPNGSSADRVTRPSPTNVSISEAQDAPALGHIASRGMPIADVETCAAAPVGTAAEIFGSPTDDLQFTSRLR